LDLYGDSSQLLGILLAMVGAELEPTIVIFLSLIILSVYSMSFSV
jgi:hypothetical protein